ncbi:hypothetical protein CKO25_19695 [Thiocapsa imhoffii]|uniref:Uncharacterized protein n=2 Tax=Thiocapsa imhoffii TaxID=382777 RepID=A0A9X1BBF7_9GAMM|nr:hypothetical protein [Thiocapsa imhoffii]
MHIEAIYDQGRLEFQSSITLKHQRFRVRVEIPDQEIIDAPTPGLPTPAADVTTESASDADGKRLLGEIRDILGPLSKARAPASTADDKEALSDAIAGKYGL